MFRRAVAITCVVAATGLATACSSSAPRTSPSTKADSAVAVSAAARVAAAKQVPTTLAQRTPLKSPPPANRTFVYLQCEVVQCAAIGDGIKAATAAIGWQYRSISYKNANPATLVTAMQQALQYHPVGVSFVALPQAVWQSAIPAFKAAGSIILPYAVGPDQVSDTVPAFIGGDSDYQHYADMIANWMIADSGGNGHALMVNVPAESTLNTFAGSFAADVAKACSQCRVTTINESVEDSENGNLITATVSALRKDPSLRYAITVDGPMFQGLPAALAAAGLTDRVKVAGQGGGTVNLADVKSGKEAAYTGGALTSGGWVVIDAALRHLEGMPIPPADGGLPTQLLVTGGDFKVAPSYDEPDDYQSQFKTLWRLS